MNPLIVLYLIFNLVYSYYSCVDGQMTWDTKDILWMDDNILIMIYEFLTMESKKYHILDMTWSP